MMRIGLLFFDDDKQRSFDQKVARAAEHYRRKYGRPCDTCYVNPAMLSTALDTLVGAVRVKASKTVLLHHFWLGVEQTT